MIHFVVLGIIVMLTKGEAKKTKPLTIIQLLPQGDLVKGTPLPKTAQSLSQPASPRTASQTPPSPPTPPQPPPPPEPVKTQQPKPDPQSQHQQATPPPSPVVTPFTQPKAVKEKTAPTTKPAPKPVKVNLKEVARELPKDKKETKKTSAQAVTHSPTAQPNSQTSSQAEVVSLPSTGASAGDIKDRLHGKLGKAGVSSASANGQSGVPTGSAAPSEANAYYTLIRDIYYDVWHQPPSLANKKLSTTLKIRINKNGEILSFQTQQSSGNKAMDESVLTAAKTVKTIGSPLPDVLGSDFAEISILFEF